MNSAKLSKTAANMNALIMQGICNVGTSIAGKSIQRDPSFISRLKTRESKLTLDDFCVLLETCRLDINSANDQSVIISKSMYDSLTEFADLGIKHLKNVNTQ